MKGMRDMATNEKLIADIAKLDPKAKTAGVNNKDLGEMLKGLKAAAKVEAEVKAKADAEAKAKKNATDPMAAANEAMSAKADATAKKAKTKKKRPPFYVAQGKSVTSKKGILAEDEEIKAEYLAGGQDSLDALVESDTVVET